MRVRTINTSVSNREKIDPLAEVRDQFAQRWVPLAARGLREMFVPGESAYCAAATCDDEGNVVVSGTSRRYTAMVLIGLAAQSAAGNCLDVPVDGAWDRIAAWGCSAESLGDAGLALWGLSVRGDERAGRIAETIVARKHEALEERAGFASMEMGWLLTGIGEAVAADVGPAEIRELAGHLAAKLLESQNPRTGLFCFSRPIPVKNFHRTRVNARLGSFASQVYPMVGLSRYAAATGDPAPIPAVQRCADAVCDLQGPDGQWWWVYHVRKGTLACRYPVYSVHQDAMGPMALLAVSQATGKNDYAAAIAGSLAWMDNHPELPGRQLVDDRRGIVWRAIQRDETSGGGKLGLSRKERLRIHLSAWTGRRDRRGLSDGFVCLECRPYHLGWILLAGAMTKGWRA